MTTPVEDEALRARLRAAATLLDADAEEILERARRNQELAGFASCFVDVLLEIGGAALKSQVPGAGVLVDPATAIASKLIRAELEKRSRG